MELNCIYKIIASEDGDWHIASKLVDGNITVLREGHDQERCYKAILDDLGVDVKTSYVNMGDGDYEVTKADFE
jgi:uncharacterized protein with GYD domain